MYVSIVSKNNVWSSYLSSKHVIVISDSDGAQEHVDHNVKDEGRLSSWPVGAPLEDDEEAHVSEKAKQEENLRDELSNDVNSVVEMKSIQ